MTTSDVLLETESREVPASAKEREPPSASNTMFPATSKVKSPAESESACPSKVRLSTVTPPSASTDAKVTAASVVKSWLRTEALSIVSPAPTVNVTSALTSSLSSFPLGALRSKFERSSSATLI